MDPQPVAFETKLCTSDEAAVRVTGLMRPLVFTNGCFDILHRGHVTYLAQARGLGASLVVALNTDASVRRRARGASVQSIAWKIARQSWRHCKVSTW